MLKLNNKKNERLIKKTIDNLKLAGKSNSTIRNYDYALKRFFERCNYRGNLKKFNEDDFLNYIKTEFIEKGKSTNTYNMEIAAIKKMFLVNFRKTFINDLIPIAKTPKRLPVIVPKSEFIDFFNSEKSIKHKCWLILSYCSGLRAYEVATIRIEDIHSNEKYITVIGKGNKERRTYLPPIVVKILRIYYRVSNMTKRTGYLFEGNKCKEHISPRTVVNYFTSLSNINERYTFHSLRHSFATYFLMSGCDIHDLQLMLGHSDISTTYMYVHMCVNFQKIGGNYGK